MLNGQFNNNNFTIIKDSICKQQPLKNVSTSSPTSSNSTNNESIPNPLLSQLTSPILSTNTPSIIKQQKLLTILRIMMQSLYRAVNQDKEWRQPMVATDIGSWSRAETCSLPRWTPSLVAITWAQITFPDWIRRSSVTHRVTIGISSSARNLTQRQVTMTLKPWLGTIR